MNGLLSFLLAGATVVSAVEEQAPKPKLEVSGQVYMPDGKSAGASQRIEGGAEPVVLYVYTGQTLCEARTVSTQKPVVAGNGWRLELGPTSPWVIIPTNPRTGRTELANVPKGAFSVKATWQRLWEGGKPVTNGAGGTQTIQLQPGASVPLDTIDGGTRRSAREAIERLKQWKSGDPVPSEWADQGVLGRFQIEIEGRQHERQRLKAENSYGDTHPRILSIDAEIVSLRKQLAAKVADLVASGPTNQTAPVDGCAALSMNLVLQSSDAAPVSPVFEIDYWLVHRDPTGKETTQHQVVRTRAPNGADFIFDDVKVETERGPVTVEVFGSTGSPWTNANGSLGINIGVNRRYVTTSPGFPWKTKEGKNNFGSSTFDTGEVVSFTLPPIPNDDGALIGHRFSVRVRMRVLP